MQHHSFRRGVTFLETILYIALLAILFPPTVAVLVRLSREISLFDTRHRIDTQAEMIRTQLTYEFAKATSVSTSVSALGVDPTTIRFTDNASNVVIIDRVTFIVNLSGGSQTVHRLRMQRGSNAAVWLTDPDIDVVSWILQAVRNNANVLVGVRMHFDAEMPNATQTDPYHHATFVSDTTVGFGPQTIEN